ncbi:toxic anion resistance protein [Peptoniphilus obesi]|uniref:toxic anion resistance protein n=1 Tax=Peptoniphilus obesi TaxID=1472765 RepID=UPI0004BA0C7D|nr:toxic anion resistance protein [Peptoniphilus obesi]
MDKDIKLTLGNENNEEVKNLNLLENYQIEEKEEINEEIELSEEERKQIEDFSKKINLNDSSNVLEYGSAAQKKIANFSESTLNKVRSKDIGEAGELLNNVLLSLKNFDVSEKDKGLFSFFKKSSNKINSLMAKYNKVEDSIEEVKDQLISHQLRLMKDISTLDYMYDLNRDYYKELIMYIKAGELKLKEAREVELVKLKADFEKSKNPVDAQKVNDYTNMINRFEKKLHDLEITRTIALQMAPQIRMVQASNTLMVQKIQSTIVHTIPLWKSQMVLALGSEHSLEAARVQKEVSDYTNELLKKNADTIKQATIETAKESERAIVDIETIKYTNQALIDALTEVRNIQIEGSKRREEASNELLKIEKNLKNSLMG